MRWKEVKHGMVISNELVRAKFQVLAVCQRPRRRAEISNCQSFHGGNWPISTFKNSAANCRPEQEASRNKPHKHSILFPLALC